ncbi:MAG: hybrid sensor histidine kinase/response regulator, partial [Alphaproteobacteria bacterium]|nr:hybrid sensor histidine kinase/response regulator [Alphaproteobacteria bacterium]
MSLNHIAILAAAQLALLLLAASIFIALRRRGRKQIEAELESLRDEIWELRAAAAARDRAEAASLAKSRFLAAVSHEFRTPLNGVMGLAQLLAMTRLTAEQVSYVEAIGDSSRSLSQLIDDILDFSKIEAGKFELRCETFALAPFVESVVELLAPRAMAKGLELASVISPDAPREIVGDPARLRQVLVNLIGNAMKFTERGGVGVRVMREGARLRFAVRDTGPGVPDAAREAIFEEFEQADPSENHPQAGAGLGLAISRRLVAKMGGALALVESSDKGSVFAFTLPAPPTSEELAQAHLSGLTALIVAQSVFEAPYLAESMQYAGAQAEIVAAEDAARTLLGRCEKPFEVVIVDCALGPHRTAELAKIARAAHARRLFLLFSPLERRAFGEDALCDFDGWLVKPVRIASLIARLSQEIDKAPAPAKGAPSQALAGVNALVAEDNEINALILTRHLAKLGAKVTRAESGALALERAREAI